MGAAITLLNGFLKQNRPRVLYFSGDCTAARRDLDTAAIRPTPVYYDSYFYVSMII